MKNEKKKTYKTMLRFVFNSFEESFENFRSSFTDKMNFSQERVTQGFKMFIGESVNGLSNQHGKFRKSLKDVESLFKTHKKKKDNYYSFIHKISLKELNAYKNLKGHDDKRCFIRV